ncbi:Lysosomal-trafficking regulator [Cricetulus griseus]|uniref:Lysosomal-trafficking regulator n=1 Tax=Cricetulus griseus TaxID=10029 RepID=G3I3U3_CRIGR|nr:Lysosomal-trafficking regulator [Cricetulus griseus]ERE78433.1 lysosomal-trafficking regulator [Cricetulus griseus]
MSTDSNSLAREFLIDVNQLCNAVVQKVEAREEEEEETHMATLGQYLVHGRGFLLLTKLNSIIDQALTCREELLTLLLSLLPLVWKIPVQEQQATDFNLPLSSNIILTKEKNSSLQKSTQGKLYLEGSAPPGPVSAKVNLFRKSRQQRKSTHRYSVRDARKTQLSTSDSEGNSDEKSTVVSKHRRSHVLPRLLTQSPKEDHLIAKLDPSETKELVLSDAMALENSREIIPRQDSNGDILSEPAALSILSNMNNSPFDLCHVLLSLLEKVCKFDIALNHNSSLATSVVPTLTEFLAGFGDCCNQSDTLERQVVSSGWSEEPVALVQRMLFRTVLHLMSVDVSTAEAMPESLRKNLTELLRAALKIRSCLEKQPDPFSPRQKKTLQEVQEGFVFSKYRHRALLLPELLEGVLQLLISCLQSAASNPFYFSQAMDLVQEFIQHQGFNLFETAVLQMEWLLSRDGVPSEATEHLKTLINSVMKIVSTVKKVKSEQLHHSMCTRKRHRRCEYSHFMQHHRDLSGLLVSAFKNQLSKSPFEETAEGDVQYPERCCCIAVCAHQCLRLLQQVSLSTTCVQILSGVHSVGICCCMDPKSVIIPLLHAFKLPALKNFQQHILNVLNKLLLDQLGGAEISQRIKKAACNICTVDSDQLAKLEETLQGTLCGAGPSSGLPSPSYRFQGILPSSGSEDLLWKWDALEAYQNFVFQEDRLHNIQIANHICNLIQKGNVVVQWKLFNYIFNPVLQRGVELVHHCQQLSITSAQTHMCSQLKQCLPQEVLQIYLKTLPILLKSRTIRDLFLSCNGVNQIIELNYLDGIRSHSLKAFETLIISLGEQQKDASVPGVNGLDMEQELPSLSVSPSLHKQQASSDSPRSLSKFYASLREAYPKKRKTAHQDVHINTINLFLCVAFLCVSKEADSDRDSANESEDTSGYDSTTSEPFSHMLPCLSLENIVLPSPECLHQAADIWSMCRWLYMLSSVFQKQFHRLGGFRVCHELIFMIIQKLFRSHEEKQGKRQGEVSVNENQELIRMSQPETLKGDVSSSAAPELEHLKKNADSLNELESQHMFPTSVEQILSTEAVSGKAKAFMSQENDTSLQSIRLLESLLAICLHSSRASQQKMDLELPPQNLSVENILCEMKEHLSQSKVTETELAKPLFDALLRVALGNHSADLDPGDNVTEKSHQSEEEMLSQPGDFSEEIEDSQCCNLKLLGEEEGYEADSESNPEDGDIQDDGVELKPEAEGFSASVVPNNLLENLTHGEIIYPEICILELNLLSASKAKLDVLAHVFESFLKIARQKEKNISLLMQQGTVKILLGGFLNILTQTNSDFQACQRVLVDLLVSLMSSRTCSEELTLLLRIFLEKSPCTEILLVGIQKIVGNDFTMSPSQYLTFPLLHTPSLSNGVSPQKSPGILNSKALGLLRRARISRGKKEADRESFPSRLLSSWHIAPIHLPLLGQNCWPHLSEGFSVSLWFNVEYIHESESATERGKKIKKRNKPSILQDDSFEGAGAKIGSQEAFYLYACGPNYTSIMPCKYGKPVIDYSKYINKEILGCEQIRDLFMTKKGVDVGLLIESLSVVYTTYCPAQYTIYEPVIRLKGQLKTQLSQRPFSSKEAQSILLEPSQLKSLRPTECKTIQGILHEIGGAGVFVFLFARVVELSGCEETQALALRVILSLIKYSQQRAHELENCNGLSMIHQVLVKQKCIVGFHILKTLLEGCCGEEVIHINEHGEFKLDVESHAIIQDVKLLQELLLDWKIWNKAEACVWETLLAALEVLIRAEHQQQQFNIKQLLNAHVVHHFLLTCQVLQEHREGQLTSLPREVCRSFVKIIAEVLGSPPDLELLTIIFNFLLAVHPPTNTYVCHNPTNFYFSLHIDGKIFQEKVQSIMYLRHSSSGGQSFPSPGFLVISPSAFTASPSEGTGSSNIIPQRMAAQMVRSKSLPEFPTYSPLMQAPKLAGSLGYSIDKLLNVADVQPEKRNPLGSPCTLKTSKEEAFISSCESARTVCEMETLLAAQDSVRGVSRGTLGFPMPRVDHRDLGTEPRSEDDSPVDESYPRRPDNLKGLASFQRSHSTIGSLGLAFPSQNGTAAASRWPSLVDRNADDWENFAFSAAYEANYNRGASAHSVTEDCLIPICCGLYELLSGVLLILPDAMLEDVMDKIIQADTLLVLVNHPSPAIQQGVIKLLHAYINRASKEQKDKFLKNRGFSLLANQLYLHRGTQELLECFTEMFFGRRIGLDEEFDLEEVKHMELFQKWSVIPVLGLIETSLYDNVLLHNALLLLLQVLNSCSKVADMLLDNGLLYVLCNTVAALNGLEKKFELNYVLVLVDMALVMQLKVLQAALEFIRSTANHDSESPVDTVQSPSAHHHTVSQKRRSIAGPRKFPMAQTESLLMKMRSVASDELYTMMQRRMSQEHPSQASEAELAQRLQRLTILAVNRIIYQGSPELAFLPSVQIHKGSMKGSNKTSGCKQQWTKIMGSCKETFRIQLGRLLAHILSPAHTVQERKQIFEIVHEPAHQDILRDCLSPSPQHGAKLVLYLSELIHNHQDELNEEELDTAEMLMNALKLCGHKCIPPSAPSKPELIKMIKEEQKKYENEESVSKGSWQKTVNNNQQRAVWYDPIYYPTSWQLDPTEGPNRERRRLQRCYLTIPNKYLLRDRQKSEGVVKPPLSYLFEDKTHSSFSSTVKDKAASESIRVNRRCISVAPSRETAGELLLGKCGMYFVEDNASDTVESTSLQGELEPASFSWTYEEIKEVHRRWWQLRDNAVEIFLTNGRTLLLAFDNTKVRDDVYQNILTNNLPNLLEYGNITALTNLWYTGQITNFEYLTHLNKHAGRSFNDLMQYPVFPFILSDYVNETLDLNDPSIYRQYLEEEYRKGAREDDPMPPVQPYHYGSHYSNSGTVLHFLVRMPPFTKMFLAYQGFDFGVRQNGERVNHVNLPPWARNDPRLFILIHRQALESDHVSQNICHWIDLVFGYKQKGKASVQAINVFHPATYFGMDVSAVEDPVQRRALETMIKTYGQTPRQLFHTAHASRPGAKLNIEGELPAAVGLLVQFAFRETREPIKEITYPPHGERFGSLQALPTRAICGLSRNFCLLMTYSKEQGVRSMNNTDIQWSAILSWGYADNILRLKSKQSEPPINFIQSSQQHQVTSCAWVPDSCQLFTGSKCGVITAYTNRLTSSTPSEIEMESQMHLYGHTEEITSLCVCKPYSVMISVSRDGTCIVWDLNRLCYVQSLAGHKSPVTAVSASETSGDIATVCDSAGGGSDLRLWTVNGDLVGHVHCREIICSVAFSNQPEGVSINVIAGGLENGIVRLWSTWDLKPVREITFPKSNKPIISLTFSCDGHHLYTANSDGTVIAWCRKDQQRMKQPMFYSFLSNYAAG